MIPVLGIPTLNRGALLRRCLESIDHPVDRLVLIVNDARNESVRDTVNWALKRMEQECQWRRIEVISSTANFGVAGSWNTIIKLFPSPYWMLVNDDIQFAPGDLAKMEAAAEGNPDAACFYANHGASFWAVTRRGVDHVGLFDEGIHPAYTEDCDWSVRADRAGLVRGNVQGCRAVHGERGHGSQTVNADPRLASENSRTHAINHEYYKAKWGGSNDHETFARPFNDPNIPVWACRFDTARRAAQQWKA